MIAVLIEQQVRESLNWRFAAALSAVLLAPRSSSIARCAAVFRSEMQWN